MQDWIIHLVEGGGYWGIFALMAMENLVPPVPSELIMGLAGIAVAQGRMHWAPLMVAATLGSTAGNLAWYGVGRWLGYVRLQPFVTRHGRWLTLNWRDIENLVRFFRSHGQWVVFAIRFAPVMRTMISLPAGMAQMGWIRFTLFTMAGTAVWNAILLAAGYWLGRNVTQIDRYIGPAGTVLVVLLVAGWLWRVVRWKPEPQS